MKKKGFTLIELLAVIVILAVIALITIPIISGIINNTKKNALKSTAYGLIESAYVFYASNLNTISESTDDYVFNCNIKGCKTENGEELLYKGEGVSSGQIILLNDGTVKVNLTDGNYYATKEPDESEVLISTNSNILSREELTEIVNELQAVLNDDTVLFIKSHPVGSIYVTVASDEASVEMMNNKYPGSTWEVYGSGRTLVGVGSNGTTNYIDAGVTGGSNSTTLSINNIPSHNHSFTPSGTISSTFKGTKVNTSSVDINHTHSIPSLSGSTTSDGSHNHIIAGRNNSYGNLVNGANGVVATGMAEYDSYSGQFTRISGGHSHNISTNASNTGNMSGNNTHHHTVTASGTVSSTFTGTKANTSNAGKGESFSTQDPYITVYMYKRKS